MLYQLNVPCATRRVSSFNDSNIFQYCSLRESTGLDPQSPDALVASTETDLCVTTMAKSTASWAANSESVIDCRLFISCCDLLLRWFRIVGVSALENDRKIDTDKILLFTCSDDCGDGEMSVSDVLKGKLNDGSLFCNEYLNYLTCWLLLFGASGCVEELWRRRILVEFVFGRISNGETAALKLSGGKSVDLMECFREYYN